MIRRMRLMLLAMMGRGYPTVIFIEAGEDPTKNRLPIIAPVNIGMIITVLVFACATPVLAGAMFPVFFPPKPTPTPETILTQESTAESTAEGTIEITSEPTLTSTPEPVVIVVTATTPPTETPTMTYTPTLTSTPTATNTPIEMWPVWMTGTALYKEMNPPPDYTPVVMTIKVTVVVTEAK